MPTPTPTIAPSPSRARPAICQGMLTIKVSEAEGRLKLTTKKEEEVKGGRVYIHVAKGRVGQITLVFP
jgi:hypothetical protein